MSFQDALIAALGGGWPVTGDEPDIELARELLMEYGSQAATARALHVPAGRVRSWLRGGAADEVDRLRLLAAVRVLRMPEGIADEKVVLEGTDHHGKPLKVTAESLKLRPGTMDAVIDAYVAGDYPGAVDALINGITEPKGWYKRQFRIGVYKERYGRSRPAVSLWGGGAR